MQNEFIGNFYLFIYVLPGIQGLCSQINIKIKRNSNCTKIVQTVQHAKFWPITILSGS